MIKKVNVDDLEVGVYVHDFNCEWNGDNLYIEKNFIRSRNIIEILKNWGIKEVYIDTEKGIDVKGSKSLKEERQEADQALSRIGSSGNPPKPSVPLSRELEPAREITREAVTLMQRINDRIMEGKPPEVGPTYALANKMKTSINRNRDALLLLTRIRNKDEYTLYHSISVSSLVLNMCHYYQLPERQTLDLAVGALFHDIGKANVPEQILNKPDKLTLQEYNEMQRHVEYSVTLLQDTQNLPFECYDIALHHHERYDGKGYPSGLKEEQISFGSQLTCVCDVFDAITSERCYKSGIDTVSGLTVIYSMRDQYFKKELAHDFIKCMGVYPIGACIVLDDGRSGFVVGSTDDMMKPVVHLIYDEKKRERIEPHRINLSKTDTSITSYGNPNKFGVTSRDVIERLVLQ